jgi:putative DNA primase/helicase
LLLTKLAPVDFPQGDRDCPTWKATLHKIFAGNALLVGFVQRLLGYSLVGEVIEHILTIFYGSGSNGKSLLVETVQAVLGEYADHAAADLLLTKHGNEHPTGLADLFGKRLVFAVESDQGRRLSEAVAKELSGGDTIHARRMREDFWSFRPSHTLIMATNHRPRVQGTDHALWRRLRLVPFNVRFWAKARGESGPPELEADTGLKKKLEAEYSGILRWLVDGCLAWQREGLREPPEVLAATAEYRAAEDTLAEFLADCCELAEEFETKASDLRKAYEDWCKANGERPVSGRRLGEYLADQGVRKRTSNGVWYRGITTT